MADYTVQRIDGIEAMYDGGMRRAHSALGVTPGEAYQVRDSTEVGQPDPFAR